MPHYTRSKMTKLQIALLDHIHEQLEKGIDPIPLEYTFTAMSGAPGWNYVTPQSLERKKLIRIEYTARGKMNVWPTSQGREVAKRLYEAKQPTDVRFLAPGEEKPKTYIDVVSEQGTVRFYVGDSTIKSISKRLIAPAVSIETF